MALNITDSALVKRVVFGKGQNNCLSEYRYSYGKLIKYSDYGNILSPYGWEIDHIFPVAKGGTDDLSNLQPLFWKDNRDKGDTYPYLPFTTGNP